MKKLLVLNKVQHMNIGGSKLQYIWRPLGGRGHVEQACPSKRAQAIALVEGCRSCLAVAGLDFGRSKKMRCIPKTRLAAVTRTVELATGTMCVSQWLTCF